MATSELDESDFMIKESSIKLDKVIAKGGYSEIWSASLTTATGVVVKAAAKKVRNINVKEVQVMKEIQHRNVITFYGVLNDQDITYIIMELAEEDLRCYLNRFKEKKRRLPIGLVWKWVFEAACGICYLHEIHHTHCDIKSLNYLIMNDLTLKLGDMGLAKEMHLTQHTSRGRGTCRWIAPEVIKEQLRSVKSDVFSFGIVLWEVFTTEIPFKDKHGDFQVMNAICMGQRPVIPDDCPQELKELIELCWQDDHHMRPDMKTICTILERREQPSFEALSQQLQQAGISAPGAIVHSGEDEMPMDTLSGSHANTFAQVRGAEGDNLDTDNNKGHDDVHPQKMYSLPEGDIDMTSVNPHLSRQGFQSQPINDADDDTTDTVAMYKMCHVPRGICLIINNKDFKKARKNNHKLNDREGSDADVTEDVLLVSKQNNQQNAVDSEKSVKTTVDQVTMLSSEKLQEMFTKFKFTIVTKSNLTSKEFYDELDSNRRQNHEDYDTFVCCILTHGRLGELAGCDGEYLAIQEILNLFTAEKCPSLRGKPKMFFIQACQGAANQKKHSVQQDAPSQTGVGAALDKNIPNQADFLLGFATVSGHVSYRDTVSGSWYIDVLVNKLERLHEKEDLMSILTEVNRKLGKTSTPGGEHGQISAPVTTLRKKVYFTMWESKK